MSARLALALLLATGATPATSGQDAKPAAPAASPAPAVAPLPEGQQQRLQALVIGVDGRAEWKSAGAASWRTAALNDLLDAGCEVRTGLRATLTLRVGKNATLLIDRASRVELPLMVQDGAVLRTRAAVLRGRCDFKVEAVGVTSDFQALTPSATLAVRGTGFSLRWGALAGLEVKGADTNRIRAIEVSYLALQESFFLSGPGESSDEWPDPVKKALYDTVFPPPWPDRTVADLERDPLRWRSPALDEVHRQQQIRQGGSLLGGSNRNPQGTAVRQPR